VRDRDCTVDFVRAGVHFQPGSDVMKYLIGFCIFLLIVAIAGAVLL
jgi:hypothetical protein